MSKKPHPSFRKAIPYIISRDLLGIFMWVCFRVKFFGRENLPAAPYIVVPNHASLLDPPLIGIACRKDIVSFMAKEEMFKSTLMRKWSQAVGCIEVRRGKSSVRSFKDALKKIEEGIVVGIFPEGTRSADGRLQEAKRGVGFLIAKAAVPVVPVYIKGSMEALSKTGKMRMGAKIEVYVGKPIAPFEFAALTGDEDGGYEKIANEVMARIALVGGTAR